MENVGASQIWKLLYRTLCVIANTMLVIVQFIAKQLESLIEKSGGPQNGVDQSVDQKDERDEGTKQEESSENDVPHEFDPAERRQRGYALEELLRSEIGFREFCRIINEVYRPKLTPLISDSLARLFFQNVGSVIALSTHLINELEVEVKKAPETAMVGHVFLDNASAFRIFDPYVQHYLDASIQYLSLVENNKKFRKAITELQRENEPFESLLVVPVQRMAKYTLLIKEILKHTPEWHPDHQLLSQALEVMSNSAQESDGKVREAERRKNLVVLQNSIRDCPQIIDPARALIGHYTLKKPLEELYILTDMIIVSKERTEPISRQKYRIVKKIVNLDKVYSVNRESDIVILHTDGPDFIFEINHKAEEVVETIERLVRDLLLSQLSRPRMTT